MTCVHGWVRKICEAGLRHVTPWPERAHCCVAPARLLACSHELAVAAETLDLQLHDGARLQEERRFLPEPDAGWRPRADDIAGHECHELTDVADECCDTKHHGARAAVLVSA